MAFFLVRFLLVLDINPSMLSFAQPPSYKPPENIFNILRVNSPSASHRGWDFTASQRREMPLYPYQCQYPHTATHIPPKHTHKQTPTSVPTAGEKTTCKSPTAMPAAWLAAQGTELRWEPDWLMDLTSTGCTSPQGNSVQMMANSPGQERPCSHLPVCTEKREPVDVVFCCSHEHPNNLSLNHVWAGTWDCD